MHVALNGYLCSRGTIMEIEDAGTLQQQAIKLGLVTEAQMQEALEETGVRNPDLQQVLQQLERKGYLTPWQTNKLLKGDTDGFFLGGYRLLYKIASGSFGRVYRADDLQSGRVVAIKVLRRRWSEDKQKIDLFAREGKVGLSLKHASIVEIHAFNQDRKSGQYYIVMEFVEGGNLREILAIRKKLTAAEALRIMEDCAAGLAYAYARGVTHRDIKLTNLLISSQGQAKLVDFGLAQFFSSMNKAETEKMDRTVDYAGLERTTNVKYGDVRSDIFFLGCVLFEMLTGRPPLNMSRDKHKRMESRRFQEIEALKPDEITAPPAVYRIVETMLQLVPEKRYQTPTQLLEAVKAARRELDSVGANGSAPRTLFIVEKDERLQEKMREKFKELGYRVMLSVDPARALDRFCQQPYDALIVDAQTTGDEGRLAYQQIQLEAVTKQSPCASIIIFAEDQKEDAARVQEGAMSKAFVMPNVTFKQVYKTLDQMLRSKKK
jgi:eukaryotic-like serine/threonine-protein kinase